MTCPRSDPPSLPHQKHRQYTAQQAKGHGGRGAAAAAVLSRGIVARQAAYRQ